MFTYGRRHMNNPGQRSINGNRTGKLMRDQDIRRRRRKHKKLIIIGIVLLLVLLTATEMLVHQLGEPIDVKENLKLFLLLNVNIIISLGLIATVFRHLFKLYLERKQQVLGSKFKSKLIFFFVILALIPTSLLFLVSNNLVNSTVDNWFNAQNEEALQKSLEVAQTFYEATLGQAFNAAHESAQLISQRNLLNKTSYPALTGILRQKQRKSNLGAIKLINQHQEVVFSLPSPKGYPGYFAANDNKLILKGLNGEEFSVVRESATVKGNLIDGVVPVFSTGSPQKIIGVVLFNYYTPYKAMELLDDIQKACDDYKNRKIFKLPLKSIYSLIVLVTTLMVILAAVWLAFHLAKGITVPFQRLAEGTKEIAAGNLNYQVEVQADDEINILVTSFNQMTSELRQNKLELEKSTLKQHKTNLELERRKNYMETVLENISSGVMSLDSQDRLSTINQSAGRMLQLPRRLIGAPYQQACDRNELSPLMDFINNIKTKDQKRWRSQLQLPLERETITLLASATTLKNEANEYQGLVLVFEDITQLMKAQKMAAWQEVAKRIAHEIKNPLTPIQLCTQRLRKKFNQQSPDYEQVFDECTRTIIHEVEVMKKMVNEFSRFARLPSTKLQPAVLSQVIQQAIALYSSFPEGVKIVTDFDENIPRLMLDSEQIKQVLVNLIDNALHAIAGGKNIWINTFYEPQLRIARIEVADEGTGILPEDKAKLFLPYFSTKKSGTGLGLAIVHRIITEHNGYIRVENNSPRGSKFIIELPVPG